jgi:hypothetical protein
MYNLTRPNTDARNPKAVISGTRFFITFDVFKSAEAFWRENVSTIAYASSDYFSSLQYSRYYILNASSPGLSIVPMDSIYSHTTYLVYLSGPNKSLTNQIYIRRLNYADSTLIYSGTNNVSSPTVAVNRDNNRAMVTFEEWTGNNRHGAYVFLELEAQNITVNKTSRLESTEPLPASPVVAWGQSPLGEDVFYVGFNNGTTSCVLYHTFTGVVEVTGRHFLRTFPVPEILYTKLNSERWQIPVIFEIGGSRVSMWSYEFLEDSLYEYTPLFVVPLSPDFELRFDYFPHAIFCLSITGLLAAAVYLRRIESIPLPTIRSQGVMVRAISLIILFTTGFVLNYILSACFASSAIFLFNLIIVVGIAITVASSISGIVNPIREAELTNSNDK